MIVESVSCQRKVHVTLYLMSAVLWYDPTGCGCGRGNPVVSQLLADGRAPHSGGGQVQEPDVDQRQDYRRSGAFASLLWSCVFMFYL